MLYGSMLVFLVSFYVFFCFFFFFFQAEDGIRDDLVTGVQTCALPIWQAPYPVARTDLQQMLLDAVGAERVQLNKRCVAIEQTPDSATAIFEDGHRATGDVVKIGRASCRERV